jgi:hypothetical protein
MKLSELASLANKVPQVKEATSGLVDELEQVLAPTVQNIIDIENKIDSLLALLERIDDHLEKLQPLIKLINKLPFLK